MPRQQVSLSDFFQYCFEHQLPVAFYRLPNEKSIRVCAQANSKLNKVTTPTTGFVFAPFKDSSESPSVFIKGDIYSTTGSLPPLNFAPKRKLTTTEKTKPLPYATIKAEYISLVKDIKQKATENYFSKAVAARVSIERQPKGFSPVLFFEALCKAYSNAFASLVYTAKTGLWIGATPEILLAGSKGKFISYSLAGTKANTHENRSKPWGEKEKTEQGIVSEYIKTAFKSITQSKPVVKGPKTIEAANLLHLRTTFTYSKVAANQWKEIAKKLHPTPAVAGLPKKKAVEFIQASEKNNREYYSGYLGPVDAKNNVNLFVNLRCMKVESNKLILYTGCGITKDSIPENEWKETEIKKQTLMQLLK